MPLITEDSKGLDPGRNRRGWVPWAVAAGLVAAIWLALAGALGLTRAAAPEVPITPSKLSQQANSTRLQAAKTAENGGFWRKAVKQIEAMDPSAPMEVMEKHQYFKTATAAYARAGDHTKAAETYGRLLDWSTQTMSAKYGCQQCHPTAAPARGLLARMQQSEAAKQYVAELSAEGKLASARAELRARLEKMPDDPGVLLRLYAIEKSLNHDAEANRLNAKLVGPS